MRQSDIRYQYKTNPDFRSGISLGTYDRLCRNVTSKDKANILKAAWILYSEDFVEPQSSI